jgi:hypothetical protein
MMHCVGLQLQTLEDLRRIFRNSWKTYEADKGYDGNVVRIPFRFDKKEGVTLILRVLDEAMEERRKFKMAFEEWMRWGQSLTDYVSNTSSDVRLLEIDYRCSTVGKPSGGGRGSSGNPETTRRNPRTDTCRY